MLFNCISSKFLISHILDKLSHNRFSEVENKLRKIGKRSAGRNTKTKKLLNMLECRCRRRECQRGEVGCAWTQLSNLFSCFPCFKKQEDKFVVRDNFLIFCGKIKWNAKTRCAFRLQFGICVWNEWNSLWFWPIIGRWLPMKFLWNHFDSVAQTDWLKCTRCFDISLNTFSDSPIFFPFHLLLKPRTVDMHHFLGAVSVWLIFRFLQYRSR